MTATDPTTACSAAGAAAPAPHRGSNQLGRTLARTAVTAAVGFTAAVVVAGLRDPGYSQRSEAISALASVESHAAAVMTVGFGCLALVALASGVALWRLLPNRTGRIGAALVVLAGAGTVVVATARQSCSTLQQACLDRESAGDVSTAHVVHNLVALVLFLALVVAGHLFASSLRRLPRWRGRARPVRLVAVGTTAFFVWFGSDHYGTNGGLVQRGLVLLAYGLPLGLALLLSRRRNESTP